ncbi:hypothetical protein PVAG01_10664 [Phlyctema vagabunda]|uniref:Uncharacterized protein n=1 Tax=Phlyctema vagabunda TaxID=108571 RepID=A0ABR4P2W7_9HELO
MMRCWCSKPEPDNEGPSLSAPYLERMLEERTEGDDDKRMMTFRHKPLGRASANAGTPLKQIRELVPPPARSAECALRELQRRCGAQWQRESWPAAAEQWLRRRRGRRRLWILADGIDWQPRRWLWREAYVPACDAQFQGAIQRCDVE